MTEQITEQPQTGQGTAPPANTPEYVTKADLESALANVGKRTHVVSQPSTSQGSSDEGGLKSVLDAINAQPERIVNSIREAFQAPKDDSKEQQASTQAKVEAKQDTGTNDPPPPKTRQQRFRDWWLEG